ncbi:hypothetical protein RHSIM_Rhsim08G0155300 [Rhododendron simsii]|uniref:Putative plant transposon protein domain-containing protein n=1 Tax=Rhododendron simsii TaxID=118357 RepID=A0A834GI45_RHOSS|nr:hypothetical protein RHSIM_Rhsim08G0155300 [Rhododendron simsii]
MAKYSLVKGEYLLVEGEFVRPWDVICVIMSGLTSWEKGWLPFSWNTRNLVSENGGLNISDHYNGCASRRNSIHRFPSSEFEEKFELFCKRPIALEHQVDVVSLGNHEVVNWIKKQEWENLAMIEATVNLTMVREFFCNITSVDYSTDTITSFVRGESITLTPSALGKILNLTPLSEYFYPRDSRTVSPAIRDSIAYTLTGTSHNWEKNAISQGVLYSSYRLLNLFFCATVGPCSHTSSIHAYRGLALQFIGLGRKVDWCRIAFSEIAKFGSPRNPPKGKLPYGVVLFIFLTKICHCPGITGDQYKLSTEKRKPFNLHSISISAAHASELSDDDTSVHVNDPAEGENSSTTDMLVDLQVDNWRLREELADQGKRLAVMRKEQMRQGVLLFELQKAQTKHAAQFATFMAEMRNLLTST